VENWFLNVPGLRICVPATPADVFGLVRSAVRDDNPVLVFEHKGLYAERGEVDLDAEPVPLGSARVARSGEDVTVVATQLMLGRALEAAAALADEVDVEVVDPRTLRPLDLDTIGESVRKPSRLLCVQEGPAPGSWGASVVSEVVAGCWDSLDARPRLL